MAVFIVGISADVKARHLCAAFTANRLCLTVLLTY